MAFLTATAIAIATSATATATTVTAIATATATDTASGPLASSRSPALERRRCHTDNALFFVYLHMRGDSATLDL